MFNLVMNSKVRAYIVNNLQPWRFPESVKNILGRQRTEAIPFSQSISDYFAQRYEQAVTAENVEDFFEAELLLIYYSLLKCLAPSEREAFEESVAFGACFSDEANANVTKLGEHYAILWDFRLDDLLTSPSVLLEATQSKLIDPAVGIMLFNMSLASAFHGRGIYREPLLSAVIKRDWINHMVWGMTHFVIAHEMSHILLGHLEGVKLRELRALDRTGKAVIDVGALNVSQEMEIQADVLAVDICVRGIESGVLQGYSLFNSSPFDGLYQHISWLLTIFSCADRIGGLLGRPRSLTHPTGIDRRKVALGHLLQTRGNSIGTNRNADDICLRFFEASSQVPVIEMGNEDQFRAWVSESELLADFYDPYRYRDWLEANRKTS